MSDWTPPYPLFITLFPNNITEIILTVFGTQIFNSQKYDEYHNILSNSLRNSKYRPAYWDTATFTDIKGIKNIIYFAYFTNDDLYSNFMSKSDYAQWISHSKRLNLTENGYYEEIFFIPMRNVETVHTVGYDTHDVKGISNLAYLFEEDKRHGYPFSARDRMNASGYNNFTLEKLCTIYIYIYMHSVYNFN